MFVRAFVCSPRSIQFDLDSFYADCPHKRIIFKVYIDRNNIPGTRGIIMIPLKNSDLLPLESLKSDNLRDRCIYEIGLIAIREVSPLFGEELWTCARNAVVCIGDVAYVFYVSSHAMTVTIWGSLLDIALFWPKII